MAKSSVIGRLVVAIGANSAQLNTELAKSRRKTESWSKQMRRQTNAAGKAFAAMAATSAAAMATIYSSTAPAIDSHAKFADLIGASTEGLAGLQHAANQTAGVTNGQLNNALQRMTRRLSEAAQGTGTAKNAIAELGLDAEALSAMRPEAAFANIADAMQGVDQQGDKVRIAFKLFDREGAALVNTLKVGSEGLREYQTEAEELGFAINRIDAAKVEYANDQLDKMGKRAEGVKQQITVGMTPAIVAFTKAMTETADGTVDWTEITVKAGRFVVQAIGYMANAYRVLEIAVAGVFVAGEKLWGVFLSIQKAGLQMSEKVGIAIFSMRDRIAEMLNGLLDEFSAVQGGFSAVVASLSRGRIVLPTVDVSEFKLATNSAAEFGSSVGETLTELDGKIVSSNARIEASTQALQDKLMEPLASETWVNKYNETVAELEANAEAAAANAGKDSGKDEGPTEDQINSAAAGMQAITNYMAEMLSVRERMQQAHNERLAAVDEALRIGIVGSEEEANAIKQGLMDDFAKQVDEHNQQLEEKTRQRAEQQAAIEKQLTEQIKAEQKERLAGIADGLNIASDYFGAFAELNSALTKDYTEETNERLKHLNAQHATGLISAEQYEKRSQQIKQAGAEQQDRVNRRLHEQNKWLQYGQTVASGIAAGIRALSDLGPIAGPATAGLIALKTSAALLKIKNSKYKSTAGDVGGSFGDVSSTASSANQSQGNVGQSLATSASEAKQPFISVTIQGDAVGVDADSIAEAAVDKFSEAINDRDAVYISPDSAQARMLRGA